MSVDLEYRRVSEVEARQILAGVSEVYEKWFLPLEIRTEADFDAWLATSKRLESDGLLLDIDNSWQALHFLLTSEFCFPGESGIPAPLKNVVMGGTVTEIGTTYGMARYLSPSEVGDVALVLGPLSTETIVARYDAEAFRQAGVYPANESWDEDGIEDYALDYDYERVRAFFLEAAHEGQAMFLSFH